MNTTSRKAATAGVIMIVILVAVLSAWRFVDIRIRLLDAEGRGELKRQATRLAELIDPYSAAMMRFDRSDQGTFHFDHIKEQFRNYISGSHIRKIYTLGLAEGELVFGVGPYGPAGLTAPVPGAGYEAPPEEAREVFRTGRAQVYGPYVDEHGRFITASAPVKDPRTGEVMMAVVLSVPALQWYWRVLPPAAAPLVALSGLVLAVLLGIFLTIRSWRSMQLRQGRFRSWIITPVLLSISLVVVMFAVHEYYQGNRLLNVEVEARRDLAAEKWLSLKRARVESMRRRMDIITGDDRMDSLWEDADLAVETSRPYYEDFEEELSITHFTFTETSRVDLSEGPLPRVDGEPVDNRTLFISGHTGHDAWGIEMGSSGVPILRYVRPFRRSEGLLGYLELGMDIDHMRSELAGFFDADVIMLMCKERSVKGGLMADAGSEGAVDGADGSDGLVLLYQGPEDLPEGVAGLLEQIGPDGKEGVFSVTGGGRARFSGTVPIHDIEGREIVSMMLLFDLTDRLAAVRTELFYNVSMALGIMLVVIALLWTVTGKVEGELAGSFNKLRESRESATVTLNSIGDAFIATDADGIVTRMNPVAEELTGWSFEEAKGKALADVMNIESEEKGDLVTRVLEREGPVELSEGTVLISRAGKKCQIADTAAPIMDGTGSIVGVVIVFHDITEQYEVLQDMRCSRERFMLATRGTGIGVWDYYVNDDRLEWDDVMFSLYGASRETFNGTFEDFSRYVVPEELPHVEKEFRKALKGEKDFNTEFRIRRPGGVTSWMAAAASVIRDADGNPLRVVGVNYDITERKETEARLKQLSFAMEQSPACVVVTDTEGNITYVNPKFETLTGYTREEAVGQNPRILKSSETPPELYRELWETISSGREWRGEFQNRKKNGELYRESALIAPIFAEDGSITHYMAVKEDITERKHIEHDLRHSQGRFELLARQSRTMVWEIDREGLYVYVSPVVRDLLGYEPGELIGKKRFYDICSPEYRQRIAKCGFEAGTRKESLSASENRLFAKDGRQVWVSSSIMPIIDEEGKLSGFMGSDTDITGQKRTEKALFIAREKSREAAERYLSLVENVPGVVYRCINDGKWTMTFISKEIGLITGYPDTDFLDNAVRDYASVIHPDDRAMVERDIRQAVSGDKPFSLEYRLVRADGETVWVQEKGRAVHGPGGEVTWLDGVIFDITDRKRSEEAIRENEKLLNLFFSQSQDGFFFMMLEEPVEWNASVDKEKVLDQVMATQRVTKANDAMLGQYRANEKDFVGLTPNDLFRHDPASGRRIWKDLFDREQFHFTAEGRRMDGTSMWIHGHYTCLYDNAGRISGHFGVQRDITDLKEDEKRKRFELRFQKAVAEAASGFGNVDKEDFDLVVDRTLRQFGELFDVDRGYIFEFSEDGETMTNTHEWCAAGVEPQKQRIQNMRTDTLPWWEREIEKRKVVHIPDVQALPPEAGAEKKEFSAQNICSLISIPMVSAKGRLMGFVGFDAVRRKHRWSDHHITLLGVVAELIGNAQERKRTSEALEKAVEEKGILLDNIQTQVWYLMDEQTYGAVNEAHATFYGLKVSEMAFRDMSDIFPASTVDVSRKGASKVFGTGVAMHTEEWATDAAGRERLLSIYRSPKLDDEGNVEYVVCSAEDMTERKRAEEELEHALKMQTDFTSTVSHELRTPLTAIKEGIAIVLDGSAGEINAEQKDFLGTAGRNVERLARLINDVLDFQKLKSGKAELAKEPEDINRIIEEVHKMMLPEARMRGLDFVLELDRPVPPVSVDSDAIMRVLVNLVNNAFKFTEKGSVCIMSRNTPGGGMVVVSVKDTGCGIAPEDMPRLFSDFEQLGHGKDRATGGTGLGLAISKKIIEKHGGRIWGESTPGEGTELIFALPVTG